MSKKFLLGAVFFAGNVLFSEQEAKLDQEPKLEFTDSRLNEVKFDKESKKSAIEQYLDAGFTYAAVLRTPYRGTTILEVGPNSNYIRAIHPHRIDMPWDYAEKLNAELQRSNLLVAAVYRQVMIKVDLNSLHDEGKYGFWKCGEYQHCRKLDSRDYQELIAKMQEHLQQSN